MIYILMNSAGIEVGRSNHQIDQVGGKWRSADRVWQSPIPGDGSYVAEEESQLTQDTDWLIDVGPFFDRFGAAKLAVLSSTNAIVKALVLDISVRKWVDLKRPDVASGIDAIIAAGVPGVNSDLKSMIIGTMPTQEENLALRRLYFGG